MKLLLQLMMMTVLLVGSTAAAKRKVSDSLLRILYLWNGRSEDVGQRASDLKNKDKIVHDPIVMDNRPIRVPAFPSDLTFLFMLSDKNQLVRLNIVSFSEDTEGNIRVTKYCIPNIGKYTMDTFDPAILQTYKFEDYEYCCDGTMREIEKNVVLGSWPDCQYYNFEKSGSYKTLNTCSSFCFYSSFDAPQLSNPVPYIMNITKRYPLSVFSDVIDGISDTWNPCT